VRCEGTGEVSRLQIAERMSRSHLRTLASLLALASCSSSSHGTSSADAPSGGDGSAATDAGVDAPSGGVTDADQFVATDGDDSWDGTSATFVSGTTGPVATVAQAQANLRARAGTEPLTVAIRGGTYYGTALAFAHADGGTQAAPIVYTNYTGETPVLSGGTHVAGWAASTSGLCASQTAPCFATTLPAATPYFEALYYNGERRLRPRLGSATSPVGTYYKIAAASQACSGTCYDRFVYTAGDPIASLADFTVAAPGKLVGGGAAPAHDVMLYDFEQWDVDIERVASIDTSTTLVTLTGDTTKNSFHGYHPGHHYIVENVRAQFHTAGQWFLDRSAAPWTVYYLANAGEDPTSATIEIPRAAQVLAATDLDYVTFSGIAFEHDNYVIPETGYAATQLQPNVPAMVTCAGCQNVVFHGDTFAHTTGVGIAIVSSGDAQAQDDRIEYSAIFDTGSHGVRVGEKPGPSDTDANVPARIHVVENALAGAGRIVGGSDLVDFGDVHDCELGHNDATDSYHAGLELCMPAGDKCQGSSAATSHGAYNNNVHDNNFYGVMEGATDDGGCFYAMTSLAQGTGTAAGNQLVHNSCHDVSDSTASGVSNGYGGHCFYLDNGTGGWTVKNNLGYRCSALVYNMTYGPQEAGVPNVYTNNIAAYGRQGVVGPQVCPPAKGIEQFAFTGNIVLMDTGAVQKNGTARYLGSGGADALNYQDFASNSYCMLSGGTCVAPTFFSQTDLCSTKPEVTYGSLAAWQAFGEDQGSSVQMPDFTDPANGDFSAAATPGTSPAFPDGAPGISLVFGRTTPSAMPVAAQTFPASPYPKTAF
jgi:hypothetical protein